MLVDVKTDSLQMQFEEFLPVVLEIQNTILKCVSRLTVNKTSGVSTESHIKA